MTQPTLEQFLDDVKNHELTIHQNNGVYRHLEFKKTDNSNPYFNITTFPNHLVITAYIDGLSYALVLSKRYDMFDYFRDYLGDNDLKIDPKLWSEMIRTTSYKGIIESYSEFDLNKIKMRAVKIMVEHKLKIKSEYYINVINGTKTAEIRYNDRNYQAGDILILNEIDSLGNFTGNNCEVIVTHVLGDNQYLQTGYVMLSFHMLNSDFLNRGING